MRLIKIHTLLLLTLLVSSCSLFKKEAAAPERVQLSEDDERKLMFYFLNGNKEKLIGNNSGAIGYFDKVLEIDSLNDAANFEIAKLFDEEGQGLTAMPFAKRALRLDEDNIWYRTFMADLYQKFGYHKEAIAEYEYILDLYPERMEHYFELATAYIYIGDFRSAAEVYQRVEDQVGIHEDLSLQKHKIYTNLGEYDKAIHEIQKLIDSAPREIRYYGMLAEIYQEQKEYEKAIEAYEKILEIEPDNGTVRLSLFEYYMETGDEEEAEKQIRMAFDNKLLDIDTKVQILLSYYSMSEEDESYKDLAFDLVERLERTHPDEPKTYAISGDFLYRDERYEEAREKFRKAAEMDKNRFPIWNQMMLSSLFIEDYKGLMDDSEQAMEYFPLQPTVYLFNGMAHVRLRNYEEAVEMLNSGKDLVVGNDELLVQFYTNLGEAHHRLKQYPQSDKAFNKVLEITSDDAFVLNNYSYYLSVRGDNLEKARDMSKKSNELMPNQASFQDTYGWILYKLGEFEEAKKWIGKSLDSNPNSGVVLEHYGDVLYQLGEESEAVKFWKKAKETEEEDVSEFLDKKIQDEKLYE